MLRINQFILVIKKVSILSIAIRMINIKTDSNLHENCMSAWSELFKEYLQEHNVSTDSSKHQGLFPRRRLPPLALFSFFLNYKFEYFYLLNLFQMF